MIYISLFTRWEKILRRNARYQKDWDVSSRILKKSRQINLAKMYNSDNMKGSIKGLDILGHRSNDFRHHKPFFISLTLKLFLWVRMMMFDWLFGANFNNYANFCFWITQFSLPKIMPKTLGKLILIILRKNHNKTIIRSKDMMQILKNQLKRSTGKINQPSLDDS